MKQDNKHTIQKISAQQVYDSRGNPTVEAVVKTGCGLFSSIAPSGASTGKHEVIELRDHDRWSVSEAVRNIDKDIASRLQGRSCRPQEEIDYTLQLMNEERSGKLGGNAMVAVSMAVCKAGARSMGMSLYEYIGLSCRWDGLPRLLPVPQFNVLNGGRHAGQENDLQEHMVMPVGAENFTEAMEMGARTYVCLKEILKGKYGARGILVGDEGGFVPPIETVEGRLDTIIEAIKEAGYTGKMKLALDCAASEFYETKGNATHYRIGQEEYNASNLIGFYEELKEEHQELFSIEDGLQEDDWDGWKEMVQRMGANMQIVGDDLLVTNPDRVEEAIAQDAVNSVLIKPNQIGTVTKTLEAIKIARENNYSTIISHRSGETEDTFIAHLAVGTNSGQCKFGAPCRSERLAKYNELLRIESELGSKAQYGFRL